MYRLLGAEGGGVRERRDQLTHPSYQRPELLAEALYAQRVRVHETTYDAMPERFVRRPPRPPALPTGIWINKPDTGEAAHSTHHRAVSSGLTGSAAADKVFARGVG